MPAWRRSHTRCLTACRGAAASGSRVARGAAGPQQQSAGLLYDPTASYSVAANRPETYRGEAGQGLMLMESPEGEVCVLEVTPGATVYVPPFWIHRSVNTGAVPLVMSFVYPADSGQDYGIIARSNGMKVRILAEGPGWTAVPNPQWKPRSAAEIGAIYATEA